MAIGNSFEHAMMKAVSSTELGLDTMTLPDFEKLSTEEIIEHLHVQPFSLQSAGIIKVRETRTARQATYRLAYHLFPDFVLVYSCPAGVASGLLPDFPSGHGL